MARSIQRLALCDSQQVGRSTRVWAYAHIMEGVQVGSQCNIGEGVFIEGGARIGDRVTIKNQVLVWDGVQVDDDVFVGPGVVFTNDLSPRSRLLPQVRTRYQDVNNWRRRTVVHRGASLGAGAVILPDVTVGEYAMVGAGSFVTRDVDPHRLVAGNPARPIGWVCECGQRLGDAYECHACGCRYELVENRLRRAA